MIFTFFIDNCMGWMNLLSEMSIFVMEIMSCFGERPIPVGDWKVGVSENKSLKTLENFSQWKYPEFCLLFN